MEHTALGAGHIEGGIGLVVGHSGLVEDTRHVVAVHGTEKHRTPLPRQHRLRDRQPTVCFLLYRRVCLGGHQIFHCYALMDLGLRVHAHIVTVRQRSTAAGLVGLAGDTGSGRRGSVHLEVRG